MNKSHKRGTLDKTEYLENILNLKYKQLFYTDEDGDEVIDEDDARKMFKEIWELRMKKDQL